MKYLIAYIIGFMATIACSIAIYEKQGTSFDKMSGSLVAAIVTASAIWPAFWAAILSVRIGQVLAGIGRKENNHGNDRN